MANRRKNIRQRASFQGSGLGQRAYFKSVSMSSKPLLGILALSRNTLKSTALSLQFFGEPGCRV